ncbi:MAG: adenosylcobalamin-dependent ribonucleoside-diphosphate reductase [Bacillota bacterium]|nr:adenosylcobalamin-dependent ribonucleoside-diphosphate reductase [Bacillota bacterium]
MELTVAGWNIFRSRYAQKDDAGRAIEGPTEAVWRIANAAALAEKPSLRAFWTEQFARIIDQKRFLPSTPIWANVGKPERPWQPSACFVLAIEDSLESMYETLKQTALVSKWGGGVGFNFSSIRPQGDFIRSTKGRASGVIELIKLYNASADMVKQGGIRRGAFMGILNADHPEIFEFVNAKRGGGLENFNLSVGITDSFMEAVLNGTEWGLSFAGEKRKTVRARDLWDAIINAAWACGEPGLIFLDRLKETNPVPKNELNATNPCGEQPLSPGESCLLGSLNLAKTVVNHQGIPEIDWQELAVTTQVAVRFLDNLIDIAQYPLSFIGEKTRATRKIGLGVLGLHDLLILLQLPYDSLKGRQKAKEVLRYIRNTAYRYSALLAREKGCFPQWKDSIFYPGQPMRNASCITIAPTGTITLLAGTEGYGIEPIFAIAYKKETEAGMIPVFSDLFRCFCYECRVPEAVLEEVAAKGSCQGVTGIPDQLQKLFKGAYEIAPEDHLEMQVALQQEVDNAISKTINLPSKSTVNDLDLIYKKAFTGKLKGITVFRAGSKPGVITLGKGDALATSACSFRWVCPCDPD